MQGNQHYEHAAWSHLQGVLGSIPVGVECEEVCLYRDDVLLIDAYLLVQRLDQRIVVADEACDLLALLCRVLGCRKVGLELILNTLGYG